MMEFTAQILVDLFIHTMTMPWLFCLLGGLLIYRDAKYLDGKNGVESKHVNDRYRLAVGSIARIAKGIALLLIVISIPMLILSMFSNLSGSRLNFTQLIPIEHVKRFIFPSKSGFVLVDGFFACGFLALYLSLFRINLRNFWNKLPNGDKSPKINNSSSGENKSDSKCGSLALYLSRFGRNLRNFWNKLLNGDKLSKISNSSGSENKFDSNQSSTKQLNRFCCLILFHIIISFLYIACSSHYIHTGPFGDFALPSAFAATVYLAAFYWKFGGAMAGNHLTRSLANFFHRRWINSSLNKEDGDEKEKYCNFILEQSDDLKLNDRKLFSCWAFFDVERGFRINYPTFGNLDLRHIYLPFDAAIYSGHPEIVLVAGEASTSKSSMTRAVLRAILRRNYQRLHGRSSQGAIVHIDIVENVDDDLSALDLFGLVKRKLIELQNRTIPGFYLLAIECMQAGEKEKETSKEWDSPSIKRFCSLLLEDDEVRKLDPTIVLLLDSQVSSDMRQFLARDVESLKYNIQDNLLLREIKNILGELPMCSQNEKQKIWKVRIFATNLDKEEQIWKEVFEPVSEKLQQQVSIESPTNDATEKYNEIRKELAEKMQELSRKKYKSIEMDSQTANALREKEFRVLAWKGYVNIINKLLRDDESEPRGDEFELDIEGIIVKFIVEEVSNGDELIDKLSVNKGYSVAFIDREHFGRCSHKIGDLNELDPDKFTPERILESALPLFASLDYFSFISNYTSNLSKIGFLPIRFGMNGIVMNQKARSILTRENIISWSADAQSEHVRLDKLLERYVSRDSPNNNISICRQDFPSVIKLLGRRGLRHLEEDKSGLLTNNLENIEGIREWQDMLKFLKGEEYENSEGISGRRSYCPGKLLIGPGDNFVGAHNNGAEVDFIWLPIYGAGLLWMEGAVALRTYCDAEKIFQREFLSKILNRLKSEDGKGGFEWCAPEDGDYVGLPVLGWPNTKSNQSEEDDSIERDESRIREAALKVLGRMGYKERVEMLERSDLCIAMNNFFCGAGLNSIGASLRGFFVPYDIESLRDLVYAGIIPEKQSIQLATERFHQQQLKMLGENREFHKAARILYKKAKTEMADSGNRDIIAPLRKLLKYCNVGISDLDDASASEARE